MSYARLSNKQKVEIACWAMDYRRSNGTKPYSVEDQMETPLLEKTFLLYPHECFYSNADRYLTEIVSVE